MKKLLFATAIAASAAAFADGPINATAFANSGEYNPNAANSYFYFAGESDSSVVTNEPAESIHTKHTANFATAEDANYLALDTEGGTLWRSLATITSTTTGEGDDITTTYDLGPAQAVGSNGTYLDTLVQFTVTEDEAPTVGADDKLAIWLQAEEGVTNLMVKAGYYDDTTTFVPGGKAFTLTGKTIEPGVWYRLTVKVMDNVFVENEDLKSPAFTITIDETPMNATEATIDGAAVSESLGELLSADMKTQIANGLVFLSLGEGTPGTATTLQGVGFQGTGAVDEIVWTEEDPFPASVLEFTLTYSGDANVTALGAVTYTIGEDPAETVTFANDEARIPEGASVTIAAPTYASGYQLASLTTNGTAVANASFPFTFTMGTNMTVAITAEEIPSAEDWVDNPATEITAGQTAAQAYPGLASSALASADAQKLTVWAKANNIAYNDIKDDTTGTYTEAYLLNCNPADVEDEKEEFVANITIVNGVPVVTPTTTNTDGEEYNGTLQLKGKVNLDDAEWTNLNAPSTTYKFYMYELSL